MAEAIKFGASASCVRPTRRHRSSGRNGTASP